METVETGVILDGIGAMIQDQRQFEEASALCLLSLAYSAERIAAALEQLARLEDCVQDLYDHGAVFSTYEANR